MYKDNPRIGVNSLEMHQVEETEYAIHCQDSCKEHYEVINIGTVHNIGRNRYTGYNDNKEVEQASRIS